MTVHIKKQGRKATMTVSCDGEGCMATVGPFHSQCAAPELDACEAAHKQHGWGYTIGFFAMLMGPRTYCPQCQGASQGHEEE